MSVAVAFLTTTPPLNPPFARIITVQQSNRKHAQRTAQYLRRAVRVTNLATSFEDAVQCGYVQDFGRTITVDSFGKAPLSNDLRVPVEHQNSLQNVVRIILRQLGGLNLTAVFLRGSLATGHFFSDGISDIDLLVFTESPVSQHDKASLRHKVSLVLGASAGTRKVDVTFYHARQSQPILVQTQFHVNPELLTLLRHYSVPVYGTLSDIGVSSGLDLVRTHSVRNLPRDKRRFLRVWKQSEDIDFELKLRAIQWLCKRSLRAGADFFSTRAGIHCRDLVPCFQVCTEYLPRTDVTLLSALQIACASVSNNFAGLGPHNVIQMGGRVAWDVAELVEDGFLKSTFSVSASDCADRPPPASIVLDTPKVEGKISDIVERWCATIKRWSISTNPFSKGMGRKIVYKRHKLPKVELVSDRFVDEIHAGDKFRRANDCIPGELAHFLQLCSARPVIVRNALNINKSRKTESTEQILDRLLDSNLSVDCRVSNENVVTFCRGKHGWIEEGTFTPPSRSVRMKTREAMQLLSEDGDESTNDNRSNSVVYIQARVREGQHLFKDAWKHVRVVQEERIWICGHGTVSCLHYDAAKSGLVQRSGQKRMLFLPPDALRDLGVYPLGHPLHRRARVSLNCKESTLFKEFWETWGKQALKVSVNPGDLLLFPSMWSHYTESITEKADELSISHTIRFW